MMMTIAGRREDTYGKQVSSKVSLVHLRAQNICFYDQIKYFAWFPVSLSVGQDCLAIGYHGHYDDNNCCVEWGYTCETGLFLGATCTYTERNNGLFRTVQISA